jgi:hypothetical protein
MLARVVVELIRERDGADYRAEADPLRAPGMQRRGDELLGIRYDGAHGPHLLVGSVS